MAKYYQTPLDEREPEKKYTVQVFPSKFGYLNFVGREWRLASPINGMCPDGSVKAWFTQAEIEKLKQRDDIAVDWNKAIIKPVEDD